MFPSKMDRASPIGLVASSLLQKPTARGLAGQVLLLAISHTQNRSFIATSRRLGYEPRLDVHFFYCQSPLRELKPFPEIWSQTLIHIFDP